MFSYSIVRLSFATFIPLGICCFGLLGCASVSTQSSPTPPPVSQNPDIIVYGATASGVMAAVDAAGASKHVLILEPGQHVGGMPSSGLGFTDLYLRGAIGGLASQFFSTVHQIDQQTGSAVASADGNGTRFEPHVAEQAMLNLINQYKNNIKVQFGVTLASATVNNAHIDSIKDTAGNSYQAKEFIDATYTGDLMAAAGVSFIVGREPTAQYNEPLAGVTPAQPLVGRWIDPYVIPKQSSSGLLPHIQPDTVGAIGTGDSSVMAYNYRLCFTYDPNNQIPIPQPAGYDPKEFEYLGRLLEELTREGRDPDLPLFITMEALPNGKYDVNNAVLPSTDELGAAPSLQASAYPNASPSDRQKIATELQRYIQAYFTFLATDPRVPAAVQQKIRSLGLCKDEFQDNGGWPRLMYVREARRMISDYVLTENDIENRTAFADSIGMGGFSFDSHVVNIFARNGIIQEEGVVQGKNNGPYQVPYRILVPKASQVTNLLVSVAVSSSRIAFTSLRVESTLMIMGQAAGEAASMAIDGNIPVQSVNTSQLQARLASKGQVLTY